MSNPYSNEPATVPEDQDIPLADIVIGQVKQFDNEGEYDPPTDGIFDDYVVINRFEKDRQIYALGVTSPSGFNGASVAFVQLASPTLLWIADWTAQKTGAQPEVPDPEAVDLTVWMLLDEHVEPRTIELRPDGATPIYRISGTYFYGCLKPSSSVFEDVIFPRPYWLTDSFDRDMPGDKIVSNIITSN